MKLLKHFQSPKKSIEERMAEGKALREKFPRTAQGDYAPSKKRHDPVAILEAQAQARIPELIPIRYARMLTSPFAFLRGGAAIMAADLAAQGKTTGMNVQACGDMHMANFGLFASAERNLIFGINDFDETLPGPWEWDLKRLVSSIVAGGRSLGAGNGLCKDSVRAAVSSYRKRMRHYAQMGNMELWYATIDEQKIRESLKGTAKEGLRKMTSKARERTHMQVLDKLTDLVDEKYRLRDDAPFIIHATHTETGVPIQEALEMFLQSYTASLADDRKYLLSQYRVVDVARKVVGVGSVGTRCWVVYLRGNHDQDPLFLQLKEAEKSVLEPYVGTSQYDNHGQRVVAGQRLIQGAPDIFLGWGEQGGMQYYVRQLRDMKGGVEFDPDKVKIENMPQYAALCAWALALAHAKSGDAAMIAGYAGRGDVLDEALVRFAFAYADQTEKDFAALREANKSGRIETVYKKSVVAQ
jgi:uncharacterized protein (DUF2252 family)